MYKLNWSETRPREETKKSPCWVSVRGLNADFVRMDTQRESGRKCGRRRGGRTRALGGWVGGPSGGRGAGGVAPECGASPPCAIDRQGCHVVGPRTCPAPAYLHVDPITAFTHCARREPTWQLYRQFIVRYYTRRTKNKTLPLSAVDPSIRILNNADQGNGQ